MINKTLYYTVHNWVEEFGEGSTIRLYQIVNNRPVFVSEIEKDLDMNWTYIQELENHVEDWDEKEIEYKFELL